MKVPSSPVVIPQTRVTRGPGITSAPNQLPVCSSPAPRSESITMLETRRASLQPVKVGRSYEEVEDFGGRRGKHAALLPSGIQSSHAAETVCGKSERTKQQGRIGGRTQRRRGSTAKYAPGFGRRRKKTAKKGNRRNLTKEKFFCFFV